MKFSRLITAAAAAGMVLTPLAAQAGTRASSGGLYPVSGARASTGVGKDQDAMPNSVLLLVLALIPLTYGTIKAFDSKSGGS